MSVAPRGLATHYGHAAIETDDSASASVTLIFISGVCGVLLFQISTNRRSWNVGS